MEGLHVDLRTVQTNMVMCDVAGLGILADAFVEKLRVHGVLVNSMSKTRVRFVTHRGIEKEDIEKTLQIIEEVIREIKAEK